MRTKLFLVNPETISKINSFLKKSTIGSILKQEFSHDEKNRLYLIVTIMEKSE